VVAGGQTEDSYFSGLIRTHAQPGGPKVKVRVRAQDPASLVRYATRAAAAMAREFDEVWCVVDVDDFDIEAARTLAERHGIELVVSDPCFEVWLLLHHQDCGGHLARCVEATNRLRRHLPGYTKGGADFGNFAAGLEVAVKRAKGLGGGGNPSTGVWRLVERLVGGGE
jgi:hypothetical protein